MNWIERMELECGALAYLCHLYEGLRPGPTWAVEITFLRRSGPTFTAGLVEEDWESADYWRRWMRENRGA